MSVAENLKNIEERIQRACKSVGRPRHDVKVLAVTKKQSQATMREAYEAGLRHFGENYVQEALEKIKSLTDLKNVTWHMIGALQSNKIKDVVGNFQYIHSVDRLSVAQKIDQVAKSRGLRQKILLQLNVAEEATKSGVHESQFEELFFHVVQLEGVELCGLMLMPPLQNEAEANRPYFKKGQSLFSKMKSQLSGHPQQSSFCELSMGTSQDFEIAIQEGATWIRLGSTLLGERHP